MGLDRDNNYFMLHNIEDGAIDGWPTYHRGDQGIDDKGPNVGVSGLHTLVLAASDPTTYEAAAATLYGSWWTSKPASFRAADYQQKRAIKDAFGV